MGIRLLTIEDGRLMIMTDLYVAKMISDAGVVFYALFEQGKLTTPICLLTEASAERLFLSLKKGIQS